MSRAKLTKSEVRKLARRMVAGEALATKALLKAVRDWWTDPVSRLPTQAMTDAATALWGEPGRGNR